MSRSSDASRIWRPSTSASPAPPPPPPPPPRYYLSPVDYEAWGKGYMPPSEHILIDQLAYHGAKVTMSMSCGSEGSWWLVTKDLKLTPKIRRSILRLLNEIEDDATTEAAGTSPGMAPLEGVHEALSAPQEAIDPLPPPTPSGSKTVSG